MIDKRARSRPWFSSLVHGVKIGSLVWLVPMVCEDGSDSGLEFAIKSIRLSRVSRPTSHHFYALFLQTDGVNINLLLQSYI